MTSIDYVTGAVQKLTGRYKTRDPFEICDALDIKIRYMDLGADIKAYYCCQFRIRSIVLNNRISAAVQKILTAHELGHDRLHKDIAMLKGFKEVALFDTAVPTEFEANIFTAELLIDDDELLDLLNDEDISFFGVARELCVPADLLDFKFRVLKHKGYRINVQYIATSDFLKKNIDGCFDEDG